MAKISGGAGTPTLRALNTTYYVTAAAGSLITRLSQPFGSATQYQSVGTVPDQLALASGGQLVVGGAASTIGSLYEVKVRALSADGRREVAETIQLQALEDPDNAVPASALTLFGDVLTLGGEPLTLGA